MRVLGEFERHGDVIERRFTRSERRMIANLAATTAAALEDAGETGVLQDPVVARLLPAAYADDPIAAEEFADATRERLAEGKVEGLRRLPADLEAAPGGVLRLGPDDAVVKRHVDGDDQVVVKLATATPDTLSFGRHIGTDEFVLLARGASATGPSPGACPSTLPRRRATCTRRT